MLPICCEIPLSCLYALKSEKRGGGIETMPCSWKFLLFEFISSTRFLKSEKVHVIGDNIYYHQQFGSLDDDSLCVLQITPPYKDPEARMMDRYQEVYLIDENSGKFSLVVRAPCDSELRIVGTHLYHCLDEHNDDGEAFDRKWFREYNIYFIPLIFVKKNSP